MMNANSIADRSEHKNQQGSYRRIIAYSSRRHRLAAPAACALMLALLAQSVLPVSLAETGKRDTSKRKPASRVAPQQSTVEAAMVRHLSLNGRIEGSVRHLTAENITLNGNAIITSALLVPGTPQVRLNGNPTFGGAVEGAGSAQPSNHTITLNGNSALGRLVTRTDPVSMPVVNAPPQSTGTRDVQINNPGQSIGDAATLRDLTANGNAGGVSVPPGTYRNFTANGNSSFIFGVAGSTAAYNLNSLTLNGNARLQIVGPVVLTVAAMVTLNGDGGSLPNPSWLTLKISTGNLILNGGASLYAVVQVPAGTVTINGNSLLQGSVACDRLAVNGNGAIKGTPGALESINPISAVQGQTLTVTLRGINTHWINGQTRASFGGEISVGGSAKGDLGSVQVLDSITAVASIDVSSTAALSLRTVRVATPIAGLERGTEEILIDAFTIAATQPPGASAAVVSTLAGTGAAGFVDGAQAQFRNPTAAAAGPDDSVYIADAGNHSIRRIAPDGSVATVAGNGAAGFADGKGAAARFNNPQGVAVDSSGVVYVADTDNHSIRRIAADGTVTTIAGDGVTGFQNGQGAQARFNSPQGVAVDDAGGLYVADTGNHAVRYISVAGDVSAVAGDGTVGQDDAPAARFNNPVGVAFDGATLFIYLADSSNHRIRRLTSSGSVVTVSGAGRGFADGASAKFADPAGIAIDGAGKLIVVDSTNSLVRVIDSNGAASTIAGTGARGLTNGAGNVARFSTPRGVTVQQSSAIIIVDTGNHVVRRILLPPVIASFNPAQSQVSETILIEGERFDARSPSRNTVLFARSALQGGGHSEAQVLTSTRSQLSVIVPQDAATGNITVQTEGGSSVSPAVFTVIAPPPLITDFNPKRGTVGAQVTMTGTGLVAGLPSVTFAGAGGARLSALVSAATQTQVRVTVPNAAVTGAIELTNANGTAMTTQAFVVEGGPLDYQLTLAPTSASAVERTSATMVVYATGSPSFSHLVRLSVMGLPPGVEARFEPEQITAGARATLKLNLEQGNLAAGSYSFTVRGSAFVDGNEMIRTAAGTLNVLAAGQTTLSGRVLSTTDEPVIGATASLDGKSATTDAAGNFLLTGVSAGTDRALMIDGRTASAPNRTYPIITEPVTIVAGQANVNPYTFYLPVIDTEHEVTVMPNQETIVETPLVPGVKVTIPAGANLRNRDGSPVTRVSITAVPIDRTPAPLPVAASASLVFTIQPGGALSDLPIAVSYPNSSGADTGERVELYAFNHDTVRWEVYGFGRVSNDGRLIEPEIDPATGRPYGLRTFAWYFASAPPRPTVAPTGNPNACDDCASPCTANTVDLSTGVKIERMTDIAWGGARGGIVFGRVLTSDLLRAAVVGRFGRGTRDNYDIRLVGTFEQGGSGRVRMPDEVTGRLFSYTRTEADGTLIFTSTSSVGRLGDEIRKLADGSFEYRYVDGSVMRFDSAGLLTAMIDRNSNTATLSYAGGNLTQITDPVGRSLNLQYDASNRIIRSIDPLGRETRYSYSGQFLSQVLDALDQQMFYRFNPQSQLDRITDKRGNTAKELVYDSDGRVIEQRFAAGFERYTYELSGTRVTGVTVTDSLGRRMSKRFNASGYVIGMADGLGQASTIERDLATNLAKVTAGPCGCAEMRKEHDGRGNVTLMIDRLGQTMSYQYEPLFNRVTRMIDELGRETRFEYDSRGNLLSITDALNQTRTFTYDQFGQMTAITDALNHTSRLEYDSHGNITAMIDALGNRSVMEYDAIGRVTAIEDALGRRAALQYDALDRPVSLTDPSGARTDIGYDANGNETSVRDALGREWAMAYDKKNRLMSATDPLNRTAEFIYDDEDQLVRAITPSGRTVRYSYDNRGQRVSVTDPAGGVVRFTYDNQGNLISISDQRGGTTTFAYDELYRPVATRDPQGRESRVRYDEVGNIVESIDRLGRRAEMIYDSIDRLMRTVYTDASVSYFYDVASRLIRIEDTQSGSISWSYDDANRLSSETTPAGTVSYSYNAASQLLSMTAADRVAVSYGYDMAGRLKTITQTSEVFTYSYDTLSRMVSLERPNGVRTSYEYDEVNRLRRMLHANSVGAVIEDFHYSYTADDEIEAITSFVSVPLLPEAKTASAADAANRIEQMGAMSFAFDEEGQTTRKTDATGMTQYEWDARGRMTRAALPDGESVSYSYDALGRRASRTLNGVTTRFLYDGADVVIDSGSDGSEVDYLNGVGIDNKLRQTNGGAMYFLQDHLGSTMAMTDAMGAVIERQQYEPFGASAGSGLTRYGYTGRELDSATGLMYYRARWYDPRQGRFITEDPIGFQGGLNFYSYVRNDPIGASDPLGLQEGYYVDSGKWRREFIMQLVPLIPPNTARPGVHFLKPKSTSLKPSFDATWEPTITQMAQSFINNQSCIDAFSAAGLDIKAVWDRGWIISSASHLYDGSVSDNELGVSTGGREVLANGLNTDGVDGYTTTAGLSTTDQIPRTFLKKTLFDKGVSYDALEDLRFVLLHELMHAAGAKPRRSVITTIFQAFGIYDDDIDAWMPKKYYRGIFKACACKEYR